MGAVFVIKAEDRIGSRFGKLRIVGVRYKLRRTMAEVICDCGNSKEIRMCQLVSGSTVNCGCESTYDRSQPRVLSKDKFTGTSYTTGCGTTILVKERVVVDGKSRYIYNCSSCSEDEELFPYGSLLINSSSILNKSCNCKCSKSPRLTTTQKLTLINRFCNKYNVKIIDIPESLIFGSRVTVVRGDGSTWESKVGYLISDNFTDPRTHYTKVADKLKIPYVDLLRRFSLNPRFNNYTFCTSDEGFKVRCSVCASDEYSKLDNGVFKTSSDLLTANSMPCRCSNSYKYTQEEATIRVYNICQRRGYVFSGWKGLYTNLSSSEAKITCSNGHHINITPEKMECTGCTICSVGSKPCILYVVRWSYQEETILKYGITTSPLMYRIRRQSCRTDFTPDMILLSKKFPSFHHAVKMESELKSKLSGGALPKYRFADGFTETVCDTEDNIKLIESIIKERLPEPEIISL